jgi:hypothetical protein
MINNTSDPRPTEPTLERVAAHKAKLLTGDLIHRIEIVCDDPGEANAVIDHAIERLEKGRPKPETLGTPESIAAFKAKVLMGHLSHQIDIDCYHGEADAVIDRVINMLEEGRPKLEGEATGNGGGSDE